MYKKICHIKYLQTQNKQKMPVILHCYPVAIAREKQPFNLTISPQNRNDFFLLRFTLNQFLCIITSLSFCSCDISSQTNTSMSVPRRRPIRRQTTWRYVASALADTSYTCIIVSLTANTLEINLLRFSRSQNSVDSRSSTLKTFYSIISYKLCQV